MAVELDFEKWYKDEILTRTNGRIFSDYFKGVLKAVYEQEDKRDSLLSNIAGG